MEPCATRAYYRPFCVRYFGSSPPAAVRSSTGRLLFLLYLLYLLRVSLLHLLRLLRVLLLLLLRPCWSCLLFGQLLIFFVLRLLKLLTLLVLLRDYFALLILEFLVHLCVPRVRSGVSDGRQIVRMDSGGGAGSRRRWRGAVVRRQFLLGTIVGRPLMLRLSSHRSHMFTTGGGLFFRRGTRADPATPAVV